MLFIIFSVSKLPEQNISIKYVKVSFSKNISIITNWFQSIWVRYAEFFSLIYQFIDLSFCW